jgi:hypothetical protein
MKSLVCTVFNVEHGLCVFVKSLNGYGLLIDCGSRARFSPIKWIRGKYNANTPGFQYYEGRQYAEMIVTHLHHDHFSDIGSFKKTADRPKTLTRDKKTLEFLEEKINEAKESGDERQVEEIQTFVDFSEEYTEDVDTEPEWGFDYYDRYQLPYSRAEKVNSGREHIINNRSFIIGIKCAGKKIMVPGDIELEGWEEALRDKKLQSVLSATNFFVASHHGHKSGFTNSILDHTGKPDIFILSVRSSDDSVDSAYGKSENSNGFLIDGDKAKSHRVSTQRAGDRSIQITVKQNGSSSIKLIRAENNLNDNQKRLRKRRTKQATANWYR